MSVVCAIILMYMPIKEILLGLNKPQKTNGHFNNLKSFTDDRISPVTTQKDELVYITTAIDHSNIVLIIGDLNG